MVKFGDDDAINSKDFWQICKVPRVCPKPMFMSRVDNQISNLSINLIPSKFIMTRKRLRLELALEVKLWNSYIGSTDLNTCRSNAIPDLSFIDLQILDSYSQAQIWRKIIYLLIVCLWQMSDKQSSVVHKSHMICLANLQSNLQNVNCPALRQKRSWG